jgi:hypothetical protein
MFKAIKHTLKSMQEVDTSEMPSQSSAPTIKAEDLLAFRTIVTMLSFIHSPNGRLPAERGPIGTDKKDLKELRVLDALSAILIRQHEIMAVVAHPYNGSTLQVFVSVVYPSKAKPLLQPEGNSEAQTFMSWVRNFTFAANPRFSPINRDDKDDSLMNKQPFPLIKDYENGIPEDLVTAAKIENASLLDIFLKTYW